MAIDQAYRDANVLWKQWIKAGAYEEDMPPRPMLAHTLARVEAAKKRYKEIVRMVDDIGIPMREIAAKIGVSKTRAHQLYVIGKRELAKDAAA